MPLHGETVPSEVVPSAALQRAARGRGRWRSHRRQQPGSVLLPPAWRQPFSSSGSRWRTLAPLALLLLLVAGCWLGQAGRRWIYPLDHQEWIVKYARENGLRPSLVAAVIHQESRFRPNARSPVGAQGLMQLLPSTARWVCESLEGSPFSQESLCSPQVNLRLGAAYMGHLRQRFGEEPILYLSAYNAGPESVEEWLGRQGGALSIAQIPFPETRAYVASVLRSQALYAEIYPTLDAAP